MSRARYGILWCASMIAVSQVACAQGFDGFYIGAKAGYNSSSAFGQTQHGGFVGGEAGYTRVISGGMFMGGDVWGDNHRQSVTHRDLGVDAKVGIVDNALMYYLKLGVAGTRPGTRLHYGWGLEYKFDQNLGGLVEWTGDSKSKDSTTYQNNNLVLGATYHF